MIMIIIKAKIDNRQENSKCRLYGHRDETANHITECRKLAQKEYKNRHLGYYISYIEVIISNVSLIITLLNQICTFQFSFILNVHYAVLTYQGILHIFKHRILTKLSLVIVWQIYMISVHNFASLINSNCYLTCYPIFTVQQKRLDIISSLSFYSLQVFHVSSYRWFFTGVWVMASLLRSSGLFQIFKLILTVLFSRWFQIFL